MMCMFICNGTKEILHEKSWKKALLAGLSIVMMGSFIAGCGSDNNGAANKDVLKSWCN